MVDETPTPESQPSPGIDTSVPHSARIWNYWLGGKDNFPVDREAGDQFAAIMPETSKAARAWRYFLARAIRYLAGEVGIRQFLDIGTGLPTVDNTHEVAQRVAPQSRVVYVDNDPLVLVHARALLTSTPEGATDYIDADLRDPDTILGEAARTLDLDRPVALILIGILAHIADYDQARSIVRHLMEALPSGSHLAVMDGISGANEQFEEAIRHYNETGAVPYNLRSREQIAGYFEGLELVEPGLTPVHLWRPELAQIDPLESVTGFGGVGRKP